MEPKFQTSFIPKRQDMSVSGGINTRGLQKPKVHGASLFMALGIIVFIVSILVLIGSYFWKSFQTSSNERYRTELAIREKQFNIDLIEKLKAFNVQIDQAKAIFARHVAMSKAFDIIQTLTIADVRFLTMTFKRPTQGGDLTVNVTGMGKNLPAIAFQSDVLNQLEDYGLEKIVKNPMVSDPTLEASGLVSFGFSAEIDGKSVLYKELVSGN